MPARSPYHAEDLATLRNITAELLHPAMPKSALIRPVTELRKLVERSSLLPVPEEADLGESQTRLDSGLAISPLKAALCARECFRTIAFTRGLGAAIKDARHAGGPTRVLYAGCGPYAMLALPLMSVLSPRQAVFTLIDIHRESLRHARRVLGGFGFSSRVSAYVCADAARYRIPRNAIPDVVVFETMNAALRSEPQVAIARNLMAQAPHALMVPSNVSVDACLLHLAKEYPPPVTDPHTNVRQAESDRLYLGTVFELNTRTVWDWTGIEGDILPAGCVRIPTSFAPRYRPMLLTRIAVYGDSVLHDHESSLNLLQPFPGRPVLRGGETLQFHYRLGSDPGLVFMQHP